jgi:hypothetical protein
VNLSTEAGRLAEALANTAAVAGAAAWGVITNHNVTVAVATIYGVLQTYVLWRDRILHRRGETARTGHRWGRK